MSSMALRSGADKVAINTAVITRPALIEEVAKRFGSQCMVLSIEAKRGHDGRWEAYTDNGREHTGHDVVEWAKHASTSAPARSCSPRSTSEGTRKGFDVALTRAVADAVSVPLIASGGMGSTDHLLDVVRDGSCRRGRDGRRAALQAAIVGRHPEGRKGSRTSR